MIIEAGQIKREIDLRFAEMVDNRRARAIVYRRFF